MKKSFFAVTEISGEQISMEQLERMEHRYTWARTYCEGKDVAETACGTGQGLGLLSEVAKSVEAGDFDDRILNIAKLHYEDRVNLDQIDAMNLPYQNNSKDIIINFEAIYYLKSPEKFLSECNRVLRSDGKILIVTANKDLTDFNPSPNSYKYFGVVELVKLLSANNFDCELFGYLSVRNVSIKQRLFRPIKQLVVKLGLMPKTMRSKKLFKRIIFGKLVTMPNELELDIKKYTEPTLIENESPDLQHKVIYCVASRI